MSSPVKKNPRRRSILKSSTNSMGALDVNILPDFPLPSNLQSEQLEEMEKLKIVSTANSDTSRLSVNKRVSFGSQHIREFNREGANISWTPESLSSLSPPSPQQNNLHLTYDFANKTMPDEVDMEESIGSPSSPLNKDSTYIVVDQDRTARSPLQYSNKTVFGGEMSHYQSTMNPVLELLVSEPNEPPLKVTNKTIFGGEMSHYQSTVNPDLEVSISEPNEHLFRSPLKVINKTIFGGDIELSRDQTSKNPDTELPVSKPNMELFRKITSIKSSRNKTKPQKQKAENMFKVFSAIATPKRRKQTHQDSSVVEELDEQSVQHLYESEDEDNYKKVQDKHENVQDVLDNVEDVQDVLDNVEDVQDVLDNREDVLDNNEDVLDNIEDVLDNPEGVVDNNEDVQDVLDNHEDVVDNNEAVLDNHEDVLDNHEDVVDNNEAVLDNPEGVADNHNDVLENNEDVQDVLDNHEDVLDNHENVLDEEDTLPPISGDNPLDLSLELMYLINNNQNVSGIYLARHLQSVHEEICILDLNVFEEFLSLYGHIFSLKYIKSVKRNRERKAIPLG